jgi:protein tyrosine phosphatase (PTP) superfamily phosphohydrolase (DUF442 family)
MGFNFLAVADAVAMINDITGLSLQYSPTAVLELPLTNQEASYKTYDWPHRVGNDTWYNIGQVLETHVAPIASSGYKTIISLRTDGEATTRLTSDPATGPVPNDEFGDSNGFYSVAREEAAFSAAGMKYLNLPVDSATAWTDTNNYFSVFVPTLRAVEQNGPVIVHCASGYRSAGYLVTYLAQQRGSCSDWALEQARLIGFSFDVSAADAAVVSFMKSVLKC